MVRQGKSGFKARVEEEAEDDMVNVNTQVSSNMELPFGEYTLYCFCPVCSVDAGKRDVERGSRSLCLLCLRALLDLSRSTEANIVCRHLCLAASHGCNPGGVSEIWRLLKKALGAGPDGEDGCETGAAGSV